MILVCLLFASLITNLQAENSAQNELPIRSNQDETHSDPITKREIPGSTPLRKHKRNIGSLIGLGLVIAGLKINIIKPIALIVSTISFGMWCVKFVVSVLLGDGPKKKTKAVLKKTSKKPNVVKSIFNRVVSFISPF